MMQMSYKDNLYINFVVDKGFLTWSGQVLSHHRMVISCDLSLSYLSLDNRPVGQ